MQKRAYFGSFLHRYERCSKGVPSVGIEPTSHPYEGLDGANIVELRGLCVKYVSKVFAHNPLGD